MKFSLHHRQIEEKRDGDNAVSSTSTCVKAIFTYHIQNILHTIFSIRIWLTMVVRFLCKKLHILELQPSRSQKEWGFELIALELHELPVMHAHSGQSPHNFFHLHLVSHGVVLPLQKASHFGATTIKFASRVTLWIDCARFARVCHANYLT